MDKKKFDSNTGYCRMLGHDVPFSYCRIVKDGLPCFIILDCWFERIQIQEYLTFNYTQEEIETFLERPKPKVATLFELIQKAISEKDNPSTKE